MTNGKILIIKSVKALRAAVVVVLIAVGLVVALSAFSLPGNARLLVVLTGSMSPSIGQGSLVFVQPAQHYQIGDVITFNPTTSDGVFASTLVTHRVVQIQFIDEGEKYITKGDANNQPDMEPVGESAVVGRVAFTVPVVGYLIAAAKTKIGFMLMLVVPAVLLIFSEINTIKQELVIIKKRGKKGLPVSIKQDMIVLVLLGVAALTLASSTTSSAFSQKQAINSNSVSTGFWPSIDLYLRADHKAVGFMTSGVAPFDSLKYAVTYATEGGATQAIVGTITKAVGVDVITRQWLILGTCSDLGEVCDYDTVDGQVNLTVDYYLGTSLQFSNTKSLTP